MPCSKTWTNKRQPVLTPKKGPYTPTPRNYKTNSKLGKWHSQLFLCRFGIFSLWTFRQCWIKLSRRLNPIFPFLLQFGCRQSNFGFSTTTGIIFADSVIPMFVVWFPMNGEELFDRCMSRRCLWQLFFVENVLPHSLHWNRGGDALIGRVISLIPLFFLPQFVLN